ncbi:(R)-mandelonitrile lyase [Melittangium boletus]|uniref:(R)-mandelonitrile lyase n=1 Tax=Melittangium boletus TaxID=83453 RepID=UPI003DA3C592
MKLLAATLPLIPLLGMAADPARPKEPSKDTPPTLRITRGGSQPSQKGPAENFTGTVRVDPLFPANAPARASGAAVTFEPGARTAWHTHPLGQTLVVTSGVGRVQAWGGPIEEIRPGDVVWIAPHQKHWHGAAPTTAMTHLALQEALEGKVVEWLEQVTDAQYGARP